jgi:hypothetical protein
VNQTDGLDFALYELWLDQIGQLLDCGRADAPQRVADMVARAERAEADLRILREVRAPGTCQCSDEDACRFVCERDEAREKNANLLTLLRRVEWSALEVCDVDGSTEMDPCCPVCGGWKTLGHAPGCELARALQVDRASTAGKDGGM